MRDVLGEFGHLRNLAHWTNARLSRPPRFEQAPYPHLPRLEVVQQGLGPSDAVRQSTNEHRLAQAEPAGVLQCLNEDVLKRNQNC